MQITGRTFVVTGAGNGIGRCVTMELVGRGAVVIGADLDERALAETAALIADPARFTAHRLDISDHAAVTAFTDTVIATHGPVDGLFNIAGIAQELQTVTDLSDSRIETLMRVNFFGAVWLTRAFLPHLRQRPEAVIMNTSSLSAIVPVPGSAVYGASKAALALFSYGLAQDLRGRTNITVTTVLPGSVWTDLVRKVAQELGAPEKLAKGFSAKPERVARRMVEATAKGSGRVVIGKDARVYDIVRRVSTRLADRLSYLQVGHGVYTERTELTRSS
ncbi:SDR family NAD(P)-dependent oxidoreductase [Nocardia cyriacigeorgica]|uniref:SDR family NAD(P)-dependent oxidoreductase n=1 Tax=Nocardia cyriacigeorgica TaxID=135487 RepID=UPI0013D32F59|nr:SDR family oxidoreductase [Nocardia cyriacigeorgica]MBF6436906.1 SDR family oxidoreductase [Nocardia cyriacigeorgica]MBF6452473.1 SDR family oxidoreductase [Nocardia cyriacigeorgica]MBF6480481.1 SDR family oxidoreductase [Nocardia cyriacigeorgica]MBF6549642.1 SDR family oxidoreductase [Nocardia cyriacigeorgica]NEW26281.1 SDR family oxidoreductase [Nocardia cyriacigeorgica]